MPYEYIAKVNKVVDGDTLEVDLDLGFNFIFFNQKVRLIGIDTPESRTSDKIEKVFGTASKEYVKKFVEDCGGKVIIKTHKSDLDDGDNKEKFGRILGEVVHPITKKILNEELIKHGYAVKYMGENKNDVKDLHMKNRKRLIEEGIVKLSLKEAGLV